MTRTRDFDKDAPTWDENPLRRKLAEDIARAIRHHLPLTLALQPHLGAIHGLDTSPEMIRVLHTKIRTLALPNVTAACHDLERDPPPQGPYHLIISSMTLHHIPRIPPLLRLLHDLLTPGGAIALADLDPDQGRFHPDNRGVFHHGFQRAELAAQLQQAGFENPRHTTAAELQRPDPQGAPQHFTIFLITAHRPTSTPVAPVHPAPRPLRPTP